VCVSSVLI